MAKEIEGADAEADKEGVLIKTDHPTQDALRALWDVPSCLAFVVDAEHRIRSANPGFAQFTSWEQSALLGRSLTEILTLTAGVLGAIVDKVIASGEPALGMLAPYDWTELTLDVLPIGAGTPAPRALIVASDPRRRPLAAPDGALGARHTFFDFAQRLVGATNEESAAVIEEGLRFIVESCDLERAFVRLLSDDEAMYRTAYEAHRPDLAPITPREVTTESIAWANERFLRGETIVLSSLDDLPEDDKGYRAVLARVGVRAVISVPILDGPRLLGYVAYSAKEGRLWAPMDATRLRLFGGFIGAVVARNHAEEGVRDRLRFEEQLAAAATRFVGIASEDVDQEIERTLQVIGASCRLDRAVVMQLDEGGELLSATHEWRAPGVPSIKNLFTSRPLDELSPLVRRVLGGEAVAGREEDAEPGSDMADLLRRMQVHSFVIAPLHIEGSVTGLMTLQTLSHHRLDPPAYVARVKLVADVIAAALSQRAARERVFQWERRFARILDTAMDGVVVVDASGTVKDWTAQATSVFGRGRDEMLGKNLGSVVHADDGGTLTTKIAAAVSTSSAAQRFELRGQRGGKVVPIELSMTRLEQADGIILASFVRDITDRKQIEAEQKRAFDAMSREKHTLERERDYLREERGAPAILGESPAIRRAIELVDAVADTMSSVLLLGESGVGKEVFAAAVHERSKRRSGPFVKVNCASVPGTLFESEFFGHAKGSFTGAVRDRVGRFELADGGTLFLDEVGEIPIELQAKLLRVLQEGEIERVGEDRTRKLDVRIVAATNRDLDEEVKAGRFRRDLYFRLGVFPIAIPLLRERGDDVLVLARHFLDRHMREARRRDLSLSPDDEARLLTYDWPGNVRELIHVLERAVILTRTPPLRLDLALPLREAAILKAGLLREDDLRRIERENLALALKRAGGRIAGPGGAAELLGMSPSTLRDRLKAFGISRAD